MEDASARCQCGHEFRFHDRFGCVAWDYIDGRPEKCPCERFRGIERPPTSENGVAHPPPEAMS